MSAPGANDLSEEQLQSEQLLGGERFPTLPFPVPTERSNVPFVPTSLVTNGTLLPKYGNHLPRVGIPSLGEPHLLDLSEEQTFRLAREKELAVEALTYQAAVSSTAYVELGVLHLSEHIDILKQLIEQGTPAEEGWSDVIIPERDVPEPLQLDENTPQEQVDESTNEIVTATAINKKRAQAFGTSDIFDKILSAFNQIIRAYNTLHDANAIQAHQLEHLKRSLAPHHQVTAEYKATLKHLLLATPICSPSDSFFSRFDSRFQQATIRGHFYKLEKSIPPKSNNSNNNRKKNSNPKGKGGRQQTVDTKKAESSAGQA